MDKRENIRSRNKWHTFESWQRSDDRVPQTLYMGLVWFTALWKKLSKSKRPLRNSWGTS